MSDITKDFAKIAASIEAGERVLQKLNVPYKKQSNGMLLVNGNIDLSKKDLIRLPDLSCVMMHGEFHCNDNRLVSLEGSPASVGSRFWCFNNKLVSLVGAPAFVGINFRCDNNLLTSLKGAPSSVSGNFLCDGNRLTSLEGGPAHVGEIFWCHNNKLLSLEGVPPMVKSLRSDFGWFNSWKEVPEHLRTSPETKERLRLEEERKTEEIIRKSVVLQRNLKMPKRFWEK